MSNLYVSLEEVTRIITNVRNEYADNHWVVRILEQDVIGLETINLSGIIDEMIEDRQNSNIAKERRDLKTIFAFQVSVLQELKQRLKNLQ